MWKIVAVQNTLPQSYVSDFQNYPNSQKNRIKEKK